MFTTGNLYSRLVYERTATILETLRRVYGEAATRRSLGAYARAFRFRHPGPEDFIRSFNDAMGGEAAAVLRRALFDKGWVDYAVTVRLEPPDAALADLDEGGRRTTVRDAPTNPGDFEAGVLVERRGTLALPVDVELRSRTAPASACSWTARGTASASRIAARRRCGRPSSTPTTTCCSTTTSPITTPWPPTPRPRGPRRCSKRATYWGELLVQGLGP